MKSDTSAGNCILIASRSCYCSENRYCYSALGSYDICYVEKCFCSIKNDQSGICTNTSYMRHARSLNVIILSNASRVLWLFGIKAPHWLIWLRLAVTHHYLYTVNVPCGGGWGRQLLSSARKKKACLQETGGKKNTTRVHELLVEGSLTSVSNKMLEQHRESKMPAFVPPPCILSPLFLFCRHFWSAGDVKAFQSSQAENAHHRFWILEAFEQKKRKNANKQNDMERTNWRLRRAFPGSCWVPSFTYVHVSASETVLKWVCWSVKNYKDTQPVRIVRVPSGVSAAKFVRRLNDRAFEKERRMKSTTAAAHCALKGWVYIMMRGLKQPFMYTSVEQKMAACLGGGRWYIKLSLP